MLHAVALHDVLYMRRTSSEAIPESAFEAGEAALARSQKNIAVRLALASCEGLDPLPVACAENIVFRAVNALACELGITKPDSLEMRLEKHIPHQAGLGGGSSDAAAALLGAAKFWGVAPGDPAVERVARTLGSDVAFFLHGGCAYFDGAGERFVRALEPMKCALVLIKPASGVSTAAAYQTYDKDPMPVDECGLRQAETAVCAADVPLFNNLTAASEQLLPELSAVREWAQPQPGRRMCFCAAAGRRRLLWWTTSGGHAGFPQRRRQGAFGRALRFSGRLRPPLFRNRKVVSWRSSRWNGTICASVEKRSRIWL